MTQEEKKPMNEQEKLSSERKQLQQEGYLPDWYTTAAWQMFKSSYAVEGEKGVKDRFETIANALSKYMKEDAAEWKEKFFNLLWNGILSPASPVLANVGTTKGQPVSCSGQFVEDSVDSFYINKWETALLSKHAFGTSGDFSSIRPRGTPFGQGGEANGASPVIDEFFTVAKNISQGSQRRGAFAAYLHIDHSDFDEVIDKLITDPNGRNLGWTVTNEFIERLKRGDEDAHRRYQKALYTKLVTGKGYFFFVDKANALRPQMYIDNNLTIKSSNLCSEVLLFSDKDHSFSCILSSINLVQWDKIKESNAVFEATVFLDCLTSEFLKTSEGVPGLEKVRRFTEKGRAIGLGLLGFHTYLQSKMIPYESLEAGYINHEVAEHLSTESLRASKWLASRFGEPEWCKGYGVRNTHRTALAPTKSTSLLMGGVSESVFPEPAFCFAAASAKGEINRIPPEFLKVMKAKGKYNTETINDIINNLGSVQHVNWLTKEEKQVFKNAYEIDQMLIVRRAAQRQPHICQGQSLNLWFAGGNQEKEISEVMTEVFTNPNIPAQYYFYSRSGAVVKDECLSCAA